MDKANSNSNHNSSNKVTETTPGKNKADQTPNRRNTTLNFEPNNLFSQETTKSEVKPIISTAQLLQEVKNEPLEIVRLKNEIKSIHQNFAYFTDIYLFDMEDQSNQAEFKKEQRLRKRQRQVTQFFVNEYDDPDSLMNFDVKVNKILDPKDEWKNQMEHTILEQFALNYQKTVKERMNIIRNKERELAEIPFKTDLKLKWFSLLDPLPLKDIYRPSKKDRQADYVKAQKKFKEIAAKASELGISSKNLTQSLQIQSFSETIQFNDTFDQIDIIKCPEEDKVKTFHKTFKLFFDSVNPTNEYKRNEIQMVEKRCFQPKVVKVYHNFQKVLSRFMANEKQMKRGYQDFCLLFKEDYLLGFQEQKEIPDHQNNLKFSSTWKTNPIWENLNLPKTQPADDKLIFGGSSKNPEALNQLRSKDWKHFGKLTIKFVYRQWFGGAYKQSVFQTAKEKGAKSKFIKAHKETVEGFKRLFFLVNDEMESDLFATSFYMITRQPKSWIRDGNKYPDFEMITIKSPMLKQNQFEGWMSIPLFQDILLDMYYTNYNPIYNKQKQDYLDKEFVRLVETEDQREIKDIEAEFATCVREIYSKNFHFSKYDSFEMLKQSNSYTLKSVNSMDNLAAYLQDEGDNSLNIVFQTKKTAKSPTSLKTIEFFPKPSFRRGIGRLKSQIFTVEHFKTLQQLQPTVSEYSGNEQFSKSNEAPSSQPDGEKKRREEYLLLRDKYCQLVYQNVIDPLSGKAIPRQTMFFLNKKREKSPFQEENVDDVIVKGMDSSFAVSEASSDSQSSKLQESDLSVGAESIESNLSKMKEREKYRRKLENPIHLSFEHFKQNKVKQHFGMSKVLLPTVFQLASLADMDLFQNWIEQGARDLKFHLEDAIKLKKKGPLFPEDIYSDAATEKCAKLSDDSGDSDVKSQASLNSTNFRQHQILKTYHENGVSNLHESIAMQTGEIKSKEAKLAIDRRQSKRLSALYFQVQGEELRKKALQDEALRDTLAKLSEMNHLEQQEVKSKELSIYFRQELQKQFFKSVQQGNTEIALRYLTRFGIDIETKDEIGNTCLNLAAQYGFRQMANEFILLGADKSNVNIERKGAIDYLTDL